MSHTEHQLVNIVNDIFNKDWSLTDLAQGATYETILTDGFDEYFIRNILKKASNLDLGLDPKQAAKDDFLSFLTEQEDKYFIVKTTLANLDSSPVLKRILDNARKTFEIMFDDFIPGMIIPRFTLGSTLTLPKGASIFARVKASEGQKQLRANFVSLYGQSLGDYLMSLIPHTYGDYSNHVKISVVDKNARIGRVIGSPPSVMLAYQCGMGDYMVSKLVRFANINLKTAQAHHRSLAMEHSMEDLFSTMDQRKASDNILRILMEHLVKKDVADYLNAISPNTLDVDGETYTTHMLCAAGNGFNTAFQTLLFWTLIKAIQKEMHIKQPVYVYGDDVIAHNSVYDAVCKVFPLLGLEINQDKSFKNGPFRESCGGDYLYGNNIRPFYAKVVPKTTIDWIRFVNGIRRIGYYNNANVWRSRNLARFWFRCVLTIPKDERVFCPLHYGDAGINTENSVLYDLGQPIRWDAERVKYPGNGLDETGYPYGAERIRVYVGKTAGDTTTFAEESKGLPGDTVLRLVSHASVKNSGSIVRKNKKVELTPSFYPKFYNSKFDTYKLQYVPYTLYGQAPEDIDDLFEFIKEGNGSLLYNSDDVITRYENRLMTHRMAIVDLLNQLVVKRRNLVDDALNAASKLTL